MEKPDLGFLYKIISVSLDTKRDKNKSLKSIIEIFPVVIS